MRSAFSRRRFFLALAYGVFAACMLLCAHPSSAFAQGLNDIVGVTVQPKSMTWGVAAISIANDLFAIVAVTSIAIAAGRYAISRGTLAGFAQTFLDLAISLGIPYAILMTLQIFFNAGNDFVSPIFNLAYCVSQGLASCPSNPPTALTPDGIFSTGIRDAGTVFGTLLASVATNVVSAAAYSLWDLLTLNIGGVLASLLAPALLFVAGVLAAVMLLVAYTVMAFKLLSALIEAYIAATIGAVQLGWSAATGTQSLASGYWSSLTQAFTKVATLYVYVMIGNDIVSSIISPNLNISANPNSGLQQALTVFAAALGYMILVSGGAMMTAYNLTSRMQSHGHKQPNGGGGTPAPGAPIILSGDPTARPAT